MKSDHNNSYKITGPMKLKLSKWTHRSVGIYYYPAEWSKDKPFHAKLSRDFNDVSRSMNAYFKACSQ